ncbi:MAG: hypothetical protein IJ408_01410 [Clostridia bacterium]|nr:hypothetical protein [Clostridia bacterium]
MESDYTLFPFMEVDTTSKLVIFSFLIFLLIIAVRMIVFSRSLTLHRAKTTIVFAYLATAAASVIFCSFLYWYWALPLSLLISVIYAFTTARDVHEANSEERIGVWGLNKEIRRIRGELFNDMTVEEQLEYAKTVKEVNFSKSVFIIITMLVPIAVIGIFWLLDIGYIFFPVFIG